MSTTVYAQRSSAVRAAKKVCGPNQEWVIAHTTNGYIYTILDVQEKQRTAPVRARDEGFEDYPVDLTTKPADPADDEKAAFIPSSATKRPDVDHVTKPFQRAKMIVAEMTKTGTFSRKEIIKAGIAAGIKYNTIDGAYHEMIVRPRNGKI